MRKRRSGKSNGLKKKYLVVIAIVALVLAALAGSLATWYYFQCKMPYKGDKEVRIYLPLGVSQTALADTLERNLGKEYARQVMKLYGWRNASISNAEGSFVVKPGMTAKTLSNKLAAGLQDPVKVTFNNIRTLDQLAERISNQLAFSGESFLEACDSVLPPLGYNQETYMAAFIPDTYEFYWNVDAATAVKKLSDYRDRWWTDERVKKAAALNLSPVEVYILGSIVDEETAKADEKPKVARLYLNRLDKKMRLQADPTVKFAIGDFALRRITNKHLKVDSPYNTYEHDGLPPGPIRMVPATTLSAVLDAPKHDYIYMCAKEDFSGYHNFAVNGSQHAANARKYHDALNKKGIK